MTDRSLVVIDANIGINVAVSTHPYHDIALRLTQDWLADGKRLAAPPLYECEVDSIVRLNTTRGFWTPEAGRDIFRILDLLPVTIIHDPRARPIARSIADTFDERRVYDSTYAALARLLNCEFWTADRRFYQRVHDQLSFVRFVDDSVTGPLCHTLDAVKSDPIPLSLFPRMRTAKSGKRTNFFW